MALTGLSDALFISNASAGHATECAIFVGSSCDVQIYSMRLCNKVTFNTDLCEQLCKDRKPICNAEDFAPWIDAFQKKGKNGIDGPLVNQGDDFDSKGVLTYTSEKTLSVCRRDVAVLGNSGWKKVSEQTCPKSEVASSESCDGGTVFNPDSRQCESVSASGGTSGSDYSNLIKHSQMMTAMQNQHFGNNPEIDPNAVLSAATTTQMPGLTALSSGGTGTNVTSDLGHASSPSKGSSNSRSSPNGSSSGSSGAGIGVLPSHSVGMNSAANSGVNETSFASADFGAGKGFGASGSAAGTGGVGAGSGTSWFGSGSGSSPQADGAASGEVSFAGGRGLASSEEPLQIEDPANYFMLSDIEVSLFKRVTAAVRKKEKSLVMAPARP
ncbi:MAG: hypothetical protein H7301_10010 [Cryobacterium sp.]|nr:hypothetical protein [Oligoflexia bacterium]